ncbi:MAG TPA: 2-C-methyl-D-erythritol 4-phosphate cytidylyltransferase [Planctomycetota bacterium]|nr:2-C-methyl-D-erythritol 4-phosphate cytidylyltransferase [Planctomycetota bacterium]
MPDNVALVIPAAGVGARFNGGSGARKPFVEIAGRPILLRTLDRFKDIPGIVQRVLVVHPEDLAGTREKLGAELAAAGVTDIVPGGKVRQESVRLGLKALRADISVVAVHDSVRPFVSRRAIVESISRAVEFGGAVVASRMIATVKRADDMGRIIQTVPREDLWMAQTPQTFRRDLLVRAHELAARDGIVATDDSQLVERLGGTVAIVEEAATNLKITTAEDMRVAEAILMSAEPPM